MPTASSTDQQIVNVPNGAPLVACIANNIRRIRGHHPLSRILVIAPSIFSAFFLRRSVTDELCENADNGLFNVEFMRIEEVADRLFDATPDRPQSPAMSRLIASELIHNAMLQPTIRGPLTEHTNNDSTLSAVQRTVQELERLDIGAEQALQELADNSSSGLYPQLIEIQRRYSASASNYLTRENKAAIAANTAANNPVAVDSSLAPHIVLIRAPTLPDAYTNLWERLAELTSTSTVTIASAANDRQATADKPTETHFYSTIGAAAEPRALIRNIIVDARKGIRFGQIVVLYPSIDYASRIKDALDAANIKNCGPSTRTLADTPSGKFVSLFLNMITAELRRDAFTSWTTSAPVIDPSTGTRVAAVPWEVASRNAKVSSFGGDDRWRHSLDRYSNMMQSRAWRAEQAPDEDNTVDPEAWRALADAATQLGDFVSVLSEKTQVENDRTWADWVEWLLDVVDRYLTPANENDDPHTNGLRRVVDGLAQVRELDTVGHSAIGFSRFARTVQRLLRATIGGDSGWGASVLVAPFEASIGNVFRSVHILGMAEGGLPRPGRSDPLLSDDLRRHLDDDGSRLPTKSDQLEFEREMFQLALQSAPTRRMYWNKALLGATNEAYPSPWFVDEVAKANNLTSIPVKTMMDPYCELVQSVKALSDLNANEFQPSSEYEFGLRNVATNSINGTNLDNLLREPRNHALALGHQVAASRTSPIFSERDGNINNANAQTSSPLHLSASSLQSYAECPYRYFLSYSLNADERIDPEDSLILSNLDRGILVHSILEKFFATYGFDDTDEGLKGLRQVAKAEFDRFQREEYIGYAAIFEIEKNQLLRQLEEWHRANMSVLHGYEGEMKPEQPFGYDRDNLGWITLEDGYELRLRGKIDLIAIADSNDAALVLDFKTGNTARYSDIEKDITAAGTKLQLPIYSHVASELLGNIPNVRSAYWFVFENRTTRLRPKMPADLNEAMDRFNPVLETIVNGIRKGKFPANPGKRSYRSGGPPWENCRHCVYSDVCPSNRLIAWDRKKVSPDLTQYVELAEGERQ